MKERLEWIAFSLICIFFGAFCSIAFCPLRGERIERKEAFAADMNKIGAKEQATINGVRYWSEPEGTTSHVVKCSCCTQGFTNR